MLPSKPAAMKQVTVLLVLGEKRMFVFAQCLLFFCSLMCYEELEGPLAPGELDLVLNSFTSVQCTPTDFQYKKWFLCQS